MNFTVPAEEETGRVNRGCQGNAHQHKSHDVVLIIGRFLRELLGIWTLVYGDIVLW